MAYRNRTVGGQPDPRVSITSANRIPFPQGDDHGGRAHGPIAGMPRPDQERLHNPDIGPRHT